MQGDSPDSGSTSSSVRQTFAHGVSHQLGVGLHPVLYVEDNLPNARLMARILKRRSRVTLLHAASGHAGLAMARQHRPGLILLDLRLPDISGEEVLRQLSADAALRAIPVAILSADAIATQRRRRTDASASAYLTKPLDVGKVLEVIDRFLIAASPPDAGE